jgi:hypothetical protein
MFVRSLVIVAVCFAAMGACAASREIQYGPAPSWVVPPPAPTTSAAPDGAPVRVAYTDRQTFLGPNGDENYQAYRLKITSPALESQFR